MADSVHPDIFPATQSDLQIRDNLFDGYLTVHFQNSRFGLRKAKSRFVTQVPGKGAKHGSGNLGLNGNRSATSRGGGLVQNHGKADGRHVKSDRSGEASTSICLQDTSMACICLAPFQSFRLDNPLAAFS